VILLLYTGAIVQDIQDEDVTLSIYRYSKVSIVRSSTCTGVLLLLLLVNRCYDATYTGPRCAVHTLPVLRVDGPNGDGKISVDIAGMCVCPGVAYDTYSSVQISSHAVITYL